MLQSNALQSLCLGSLQVVQCQACCEHTTSVSRVFKHIIRKTVAADSPLHGPAAAGIDLERSEFLPRDADFLDALHALGYRGPTGVAAGTPGRPAGAQRRARASRAGKRGSAGAAGSAGRSDDPHPPADPGAAPAEPAQVSACLRSLQRVLRALTVRCRRAVRRPPCPG